MAAHFRCIGQGADFALNDPGRGLFDESYGEHLHRSAVRRNSKTSRQPRGTYLRRTGNFLVHVPTWTIEFMMRPQPIPVFFIACIVFSIACIVAFVGLESVSAEERESEAVEHLRTFAKLYGYVRFFHPSDEAAATDWERFAIHGVREIEDVENTADLRRVLEALFHPLAPTLQIYRDDASPPGPRAEIPAGDAIAADLEVVAWQHRGIGLDTASVYRSSRLNRVGDQMARPAFGVLMQYLDAADLRGRDIRLRSAARAEVEAPESRLQLWVRVDRADQQPGFFDNMDDRPITTAEWGTYEITGPVAEDAVGVAVGAFLSGTGRGFVDDFTIEVRGHDGTWKAVSLQNPDFLVGDLGVSPPGWMAQGRGYHFATVGEDYNGDGRAAAIALDPDQAYAPGQLFLDYPQPTEFVEKPIGAGLAVRMPLALYSREEQTLPEADVDALDALRAALDEIDIGSAAAEEASVRMAGIVIAWNILQHFYPYFDVVDTDWDAALTTALTDALDDTGRMDYVLTLRRMVAALHDGHGNAGHSLPLPEGWLPILGEMIEDEVVVVATRDSANFQVGDVVLAVDGRPVHRRLDEEMAFYSGSQQWRRLSALRRLGRGDHGTDVDVLLRRGEEEVHLTVPRQSGWFAMPSRPERISEIRPAIYYVDLSAAEVPEIEARMDELANADGVIFDIRGYPRGNHAVLQHLADFALHSARWRIPHIIYPDQEEVFFDTTAHWTLPPREPRIGGEVVFLTNEHAISYAESVMGIVEGYRLGEIVGRPTAGTNGNINRIQLPGGFYIAFTGMRVLKHDGSQLHLVGVQPTIAVERTLQAVRDGRDEDIEAAIEVIRSRSDR